MQLVLQASSGAVISAPDVAESLHVRDAVRLNMPTLQGSIEYI